MSNVQSPKPKVRYRNQKLTTQQCQLRDEKVRFSGGPWILDIGLWPAFSGPWILDIGHRTVSGDFGLKLSFTLILERLLETLLCSVVRIEDVGPCQDLTIMC